MSPITLYTFPLSGHAHRAELMLNLLQLPYVARLVDLRAGAQRDAAFLALNPFGQVPVIDDNGTVVADSNAILVYLARRYGPTWLAQDAEGEAAQQRWLSAAASLLAFGPAAARANRHFGAKHNPDDALARAARLYGGMEQHLATRAYLLGSAPTIADVALYSYTAAADEGGVSLADYPQVRAWLTRIEALPGFIPMPRFA